MTEQLKTTLKIEIESLDEALKAGRLREAFALVAQILIDVKRLLAL